MLICSLPFTSSYPDLSQVEAKTENFEFSQLVFICVMVGMLQLGIQSRFSTWEIHTSRTLSERDKVGGFPGCSWKCYISIPTKNSKKSSVGEAAAKPSLGYKKDAVLYVVRKETWVIEGNGNAIMFRE